ncbi:MAG: O-antigen ligase family protein [Thermoguttaceae bacterium]
MIWILVGYMWLFLHRPFEIWPILGTVRIERVYMILTLTAWLATIADKTWTNNRNNWALFLVAFSIFISTLLTPFERIGLGENLTTENWFKVFVFFILVMTSVKTEKDLKILITSFTVCFTLYMLHSFREYRNGKHVYRMGVARMVGVDSTMSDPNTFGNGINYAMCLLFPLYELAKEQVKKVWKRRLYILCGLSFCLSVLCIQLTGSRSSFTALAFSMFALAMLSKYRFRLLLLLAIAAPLIWFSLTEDLQNRYMTLIDPSRGPESAQGSAQRSKGFWIGLEIWKDNLMFGVGPEGFQRVKNTEMTGSQAHNLYGQVLAELGTLGIIAYVSLILSIWSNHYIAFKLYKKMKRQGREKDGAYLYNVSFAVAWTVVLLLGLGGGGHNAFRYTWVWYGAFQAIAVEMLKKKANSNFINIKNNNARHIRNHPGL